jgi:hypothetical protein
MEMVMVYRSKAHAIRAVGVRLTAIVIALLVTLILAGAAAGVGSRRSDEWVPSVSTGPTRCILDGHRVPCS